MKWVNSIGVMRTYKMADFEDHVAIFLILFLPFLFVSALLTAKSTPLSSNAHYAIF